MGAATTARREPDRLADLRRLATALALLRDEMERVRAGTTRIAALEARRPLTPAERAAARRLRLDGQRIGLELANLRAAFARVQARLS